MLDGAAPLAIRALPRPHTFITPSRRRAHGPRRDVGVGDAAREERQRRERPVEGHLVAGLVHAHEGEAPRLAHLPVHDAVRGREVRVPGGGEVRGGDEERDGFGAEP